MVCFAFILIRFCLKATNEKKRRDFLQKKKFYFSSFSPSYWWPHRTVRIVWNWNDTTTLRAFIVLNETEENKNKYALAYCLATSQIQLKWIANAIWRQSIYFWMVVLFLDACCTSHRIRRPSEHVLFYQLSGSSLALSCHFIFVFIVFVIVVDSLQSNKWL